MKPFVLTAWTFLSIGIAFGSIWAYYELGWGGWWFWDPVENASFMPWLLGTALVHSLIAVEKENHFNHGFCFINTCFSFKCNWNVSCKIWNSYKCSYICS
ncbi:MAG: cytochrome c biogenesis protein CcsA [Pelagibacteraceae bacterium]|nr:cytochrome c biogenesis protein CcsA [Pelagibacteraceae bacterium]